MSVVALVALLAFAPSPVPAGQEAVEIGFRGEIRSQWEVMPERTSVRVGRGEIVDAGVRVSNKSDREVIAMIVTEIGPPAFSNYLVHLSCGPAFTLILQPGEVVTVPVSYLVMDATPRGSEGFQIVYAVYSFETLNRDPLHVGRDIYTARCATCHGALGRGDGPVARALSRGVGDLAPALRAKEDRDILGAIGAGVGPMPAFSPVLSESEQRALLLHLRSLPAAGNAGPER